MKKYYRWLDALRGVCAILVVTRHIIPYFVKVSDDIIIETLNFILTNVVDCGKIGVVGFFLISGFLVPVHLHNKTRMEFIMNRIIRLYPTYWFSIILSVILLRGFSLIQILLNLTMLQMYFGIDDVIGVYWTLPIEILFYIGCLIIQKFIKKNNIRVIDIIFFAVGLGTVFLSLARYKTGLKLPVALPLLIFVSILGYYIRLQNDNLISLKILASRLFFFLLILCPSCITAYNTDMGFGEKWYVYCLSYISGISLFLIFKKLDVKNKVLLWVGGISYSLYLTHRIFISFFCDKGQQLSWLYLLFVLTVIFSAAYLTNRFIEKKSYDFLKRNLKGI